MTNAPRDHYTPSSVSSGRVFAGPVVDTETHVFLRAWPIDTNPQMSAVEPYTRSEYSGEVLLAEMDRAGVDAAVLIGYDGYDFPQFMQRFGSDPGDFMGGRRYTSGWASRAPDRLRFVTTLRNPASWDALALLEDELAAGAVGVKIFPAYLALRPDAAEIRAAFDVLRAHGAAAIFGLEDTVPPDTPALTECYADIGALASDYPDVPIQLNHGGNARLDTDDPGVLFETVNAHENILVSTSVLGGPLMVWADEWRYPFPVYLEHLAAYFDGVPARKLAWGTDWPWFEGVVKYPQLLQSIVDHATFMTDEDRRLYLAGSAMRHWGVTVDMPAN